MSEGATGLIEAGAGAQPQAGERRRGIDRVIMLLEALLKHRAPMRIGDIAKMINAPRSTTYEIVNSLLEAEMLENVGSEGYVYFGRAMHLFGWAYSHHNAHYRRILETLDRMAAETGETVQLCGLRGNKYVVLDCRDSPGPFRISSDVGVEVPIPWTASGRLLVGHMQERELKDFIPAADYELPDGRVIAPDEFFADVDLARRQGFSETSALADRFTWCMAAPIRDSHGAINTTLCFVLPVDTPEPRRNQLLELLRERASALSLAGS
ncbi:IclR family transcriptional regulator [Mesorhizobium sp.]|uniref:IclR family transcriptional regulator n=1 Tax=Mesorhizobium sp. TaxID=1871066 RepID=UPI000FE4D64D|nr:IclR family transcriptional regulator [Mesorhizobium sp.]RWH29010.1 MAG: IclR family transcriptional regulator [Mesorhizobium sp.]RWH37064.1 MAG: IclR family transcriptional regulator [Mesorhizobium sp.]TIM70722.1 MAG: IclR family transcriptional regulator [Mesorhizobium sp.]TIR61099.1 MAG: IclR family transcriptional regulator [Mesorhizobium sp.]TIR68364.1 MAG: IclR family transcriptional regulator [Mesorhizobium sp.]